MDMFRLPPAHQLFGTGRRPRFNSLGAGLSSLLCLPSCCGNPTEVAFFPGEPSYKTEAAGTAKGHSGQKTRD